MKKTKKKIKKKEKPSNEEIQARERLLESPLRVNKADVSTVK